MSYRVFCWYKALICTKSDIYHKTQRILVKVLKSLPKTIGLGVSFEVTGALPAITVTSIILGISGCAFAKKLSGYTYLFLLALEKNILALIYLTRSGAGYLKRPICIRGETFFKCSP